MTGKYEIPENLDKMIGAARELPKSLSTKADYVRTQKQDRRHTCHWPGCQKQVPPAMWGCRSHWYALPAELRRHIWRAYRPGQERDLHPSAEYIEAAKAVQEWILGSRT